MAEQVKNSSFQITVNRNAVSKPLLETNEASSIEIRDNGKLVMLVVLIPGRPVALVSAADKDVDFESFAMSLGFKMFKYK